MSGKQAFLEHMLLQLPFNAEADDEKRTEALGTALSLVWPDLAAYEATELVAHLLGHFWILPSSRTAAIELPRDKRLRIIFEKIRIDKEGFVVKESGGKAYGLFRFTMPEPTTRMYVDMLLERRGDGELPKLKWWTYSDTAMVALLEGIKNMLEGRPPDAQ